MKYVFLVTICKNVVLLCKNVSKNRVDSKKCVKNRVDFKKCVKKRVKRKIENPRRRAAYRSATDLHTIFETLIVYY